jgi:hypothetical protein
MYGLCQAMDWKLTDDTPFVHLALKEWNSKRPAWTKPVQDFGKLTPEQQSQVLMISARIKMEQAG